MRGEGEKSGVHAAGVGDDEATAASGGSGAGGRLSHRAWALCSAISIILEKSSYPANTAAPCLLRLPNAPMLARVKENGIHSRSERFPRRSGGIPGSGRNNPVVAGLRGGILQRTEVRVEPKLVRALKAALVELAVSRAARGTGSNLQAAGACCLRVQSAVGRILACCVSMTRRKHRLRQW